jgi:hypothetical protein
MPSPFPGMNPYLEQNDTWEDFHQRFITHAADTLATMVGGNYLVKIEVRLYLHELSAEERRYFGRAEVGLADLAKRDDALPASLAVTAPVPLKLPAVEVERHSSIEIRDRRNRRRLTVLELLSPTNKTAGPDRDEYLLKRGQLFARTAPIWDCGRSGCARLSRSSPSR